MTELMQELAERLYEGDADAVAALTARALEQGSAALDILNQGLLPAMQRVGQDFRDGEVFIPEVIVAARAMHAALELLQPLLAQSASASPGKVVLGTVKGDLHDIGKKLVAIMLQGAGFQVIDLGHDVSAEAFVQAVREHAPEFVGLSALLSTTMPMMRETVAALRGPGVPPVRILVGGAPVTQAWADEIGADGYAPDAVGAVECARKLLAVQAGR
jgi:5-methyltetrahydrofolate--homocysteine methyltransferase